ncbi:MAG: hypothetical protein RLZZ292_2605 [Bacteroidota bacterium]|jgi:hypothetical protein
MFLKFSYLSLCAIFVTQLILLQSCDSRLKADLNPNYEGDKITLNGILSPDSSWIQLTKSVSPFADHLESELFVKNGKIWIENKEGNLILALMSQDGFNFRDYSNLLLAGQVYKLKASADGLKLVETDWIEIPVKTKKIKFSSLLPKDLGEGSFTLSFFNNSASNTYYNINAISLSKEGIGSVNISADKDVIKNKCNFFRLTFSSDCLDGNENQLSYRYENGNGLNVALDSFVCRFGTVSEAAFLYAKTLDNGNESALFDGINDPIPSFSNVKNGYGVVFGQNWETYKLVIK